MREHTFDETQDRSKRKLNRQFYKLCVTENLPFVIDIARSHGAYLRSVEGQDIFDWAGYYGSKLLAHNHPALYEKRYLQRLIRAANNKVPNPDFLTRECLEFYKLAFSLAPASMKRSRTLEVYAVNSGAEVVENMLKYLISRFNSRAGRADKLSRRRFIVFRNSFHGRTVFALSITNVPSAVMLKDFHPLFHSALQADFPAAVFSGFDPEQMRRHNDRATDRTLASIQALLLEHAGTVVAVITEPVQSAGGHRVALPRFFEELSALTWAHDVQLGIDEVQTGLGGTGKTYYVDHLNLPHPPQALVVAKKFGVGVLYMLDHLVDVGVLDSTWGGPLVDMVRATQEIAIVKRERLIERTARLGEMLLNGLRDLERRYPDCLINSRGLGFVQGFTVLPAHTSQARDLFLEIALREHLLLMLDAGKSAVRLRPSLSTSKADVTRFLDVLEQCLKRYSKTRPRQWVHEAQRQRKGSPEMFMRLSS